MHNLGGHLEDGCRFFSSTRVSLENYGGRGAAAAASTQGFNRKIYKCHSTFTTPSTRPKSVSKYLSY